MSKVTLSNGCTTFEGQDAILLVKAVVLKNALRLAIKGLKISRVSNKRLLEAATVITHKPYKQRQYEQAAVDLEQWIAAMKAALPFEDKRTTEEK